MIHRLTDEVYWGDWQSPLELPGVRAIINVAHSFSARRGRNIYWARLEQVDWRCLYYRIAKKDAQAVDDGHLEVLIGALRAVRVAAAFPLLCHCQMGGHRGPSTALFAAWYLAGGGREVFEELHARIVAIRPGFGQGRNNGYYKSIVDCCVGNKRIAW